VKKASDIFPSILARGDVTAKPCSQGEFVEYAVFGNIFSKKLNRTISNENQDRILRNSEFTTTTPAF
jgi:hypothetical protein